MVYENLKIKSNCLGDNYELQSLTSSWNFDNIFKSDSARIDAIKKVFTQITRLKSKYAWIKQYPSIGYQSALRDLKFAFCRWRLCLLKFSVKKPQKKVSSLTVSQHPGVYPN
ncbi:MAG: hypothetical protein F6K10_10330 [Moorea sp. SIO2B7]|nr:hypothetical protein [Moorena sp. SIO2B7]